MLIKLFPLFVNGAGVYGGNGQGMGTGLWLAARRSPALQSAWILVRSPHWGNYTESGYQPLRDQYLSSFLKWEVEAFLREHPWRLQHCGGYQGLPGAHSDVPQPSKNGEQLNTEDTRDLSGATALSATKGVAISNRVSAHCHLLFQLLALQLRWMKSQLCRLKLTDRSCSRILKSQWKIPILWLFPAQSLLPDTFSCVCDWLSQFLVQDKWGKRGNRARCGEWLVPLAGDGPVWGARGSQRLGKGACLCHLPPFSPPRRKITAGNGIEVTWSPSANLGRFALHCFKLL